MAHPHAHHGGGPLHALRELFAPHSHDAADRVDSALETSEQGIRALKISLAGLGVTAVLQAFVVVLSGSVALLGDTVHNIADALTAVPLGAAFLLGRRAATRRFTYGFGRAEDLAGVAVVLTIAASAGYTAYEAVDRLFHPRDVSHLGAVAAAAIIGFIGNEWVARYRVRTGRRIGSAALVADGLHARTDGFTSLAVLLSAGGAALGWRFADPVVGLLITVAILLVLRDSAREVFQRLMDSVDPALTDRAESTLVRTPGVHGVTALRLRWIGHRLHGEATIEVDPELTIRQAHAVAVAAEHALLHALPHLVTTLIHTDPLPARDPHATPEATDPHRELAHHLT